MNIRYPIYEGVYRILTFVIGSVLGFVFRKCRDCTNTAYKIVKENKE